MGRVLPLATGSSRPSMTFASGFLADIGHRAVASFAAALDCRSQREWREPLRTTAGMEDLRDKWIVRSASPFARQSVSGVAGGLPYKSV